MAYVDMRGGSTTNQPEYVQQYGPEFRPDRTAAPTTLSVSGTSAESAQLSSGLYEMHCTTDCAYEVGATGGSAVWGTDDLIYAGERLLLAVTGTSDDYVRGVTNGATGTLYLKRIGD
jgi:hypothetical protein